MIFFGLFVFRAMSSQRRGRGQHQGAPQARSFTDPDPTFSRETSGSSGAETPSAAPTFTGVAPGWFTDPSGRHQQRYWSGSEWTEHVMDTGMPGTDPPPGHGSRTQSP